MTTDYAPFAAMYTIVYDEDCDHFLIEYDDKKEMTYMEDEEEGRQVNMDYDCCNRPAKSRKLNMMWIVDIKKHYNWKPGEILTFCIRQNTSNCFYVSGTWSTDDDGSRSECNTRFYDIGIDEDGFVVRRYFQYYKFETTALIPNMAYYVRADCVYNDSLVGQDIRS
jgi:hypothetical protein